MTLKRLFSSRNLFKLRGSPVLQEMIDCLLSKIQIKCKIAVHLNGHTMYAHTLDRFLSLMLWKYKILENFESKVINSELKKGMVALDIGANIGIYSLQMARSVGKTGKVIAFEPDPGNYSLILKNIEANGYTNIVTVQKAVTDVTGTARLFLCRENRGDHRIFDSSVDRESIEIETVRLDDYLSDRVAVDVIKMDIQGSEFLALAGMKNILANNDVKIITEFCPVLMNQCGQSPEIFLDMIKDHGFSINYINEGDEKIESVSSHDLMTICDREKYVNLYLEKRRYSVNVTQ